MRFLPSQNIHKSHLNTSIDLKYRLYSAIINLSFKTNLLKSLEVNNTLGALLGLNPFLNNIILLADIISDTFLRQCLPQKVSDVIQDAIRLCPKSDIADAIIYEVFLAVGYPILGEQLGRLRRSLVVYNPHATRYYYDLLTRSPLSRNFFSGSNFYCSWQEWSILEQSNSSYKGVRFYLTPKTGTSIAHSDKYIHLKNYSLTSPVDIEVFHWHNKATAAVPDFLDFYNTLNGVTIKILDFSRPLDIQAYHYVESFYYDYADEPMIHLKQDIITREQTRFPPLNASYSSDHRKKLLLHIRTEHYKKDLNKYNIPRNADPQSYADLVRFLIANDYEITHVVSCESDVIHGVDSTHYNLLDINSVGAQANQLRLIHECTHIIGALSGISHLTHYGVAKKRVYANAIHMNFVEPLGPHHLIFPKDLTPKHGKPQITLKEFFCLYFAPWESDDGLLTYFDCLDIPSHSLKDDIISFFNGDDHIYLSDIMKLYNIHDLVFPPRRIAKSSAHKLTNMINSIDFKV